jgi:hypothetical protein
MELMSKTDFNEMRKMVEILERFEKLSKWNEPYEIS